MPSSAYEIIDRKSTRLNSSHTIISYAVSRSEEHTSELQSHDNLVCRIIRSKEHTSELQSHDNLVCRLLLEKKQNKDTRDAAQLRTSFSEPQFLCSHPS